MIIRITLESHKLTQIIEKYFDDGGCFVATNYSSAEDYKEFMKNVESYNRYSMSPKKTKQKEKKSTIAIQLFFFLCTLPFSAPYTKPNDS